MQIKNFTVYRGDNTNLSWTVNEDLTDKVLLFAVKASKIINATRLIEKTPAYESGSLSTSLTASDTGYILHQNLYYDLINVTDNITIATGKIILQADVITKADGYLQGQIDDDNINNYSVWSSQKTNNQLQTEITARQNADTNLQSQITTLQTDSHTHNNKTLLDTYNQTNADITDAVAKKHSHTNQTILDNITESFTTTLKTNYNNHLANTSNPHAVTKTQVGLSNVTNDAQLKRADGDFNSFTEKTSLADNDIILLEDSTSAYAKKKSTIVTLQNKLDTRYAIQPNFAPPQGVIFDGINDYYQINHNANFNIVNTDYSFEAYIKSGNNVSNNYGIISKYSSSPLSGYDLYISAGMLRISLFGSGTYTNLQGGAVNTNTIYHCVAVISGNSVFLYLNTQLIGSTTITNTLENNTISLKIGARDLGALQFNGKIYYTRLYNRALSQSEVTKLYNNGLPHLAELDYADSKANQTAQTSGSLLFGKRYRIDNYVTGDDFTNIATVESGTINTTGCIFIAKGTTPTTWANGSSLRQIGCVAEYKSENAGTMGWIETQNQLHTVSNGNPVAPAGYRDYKSGIASTTIQFVNSQKAQTILKQIVVKNNYAGANTVSLGTTTNANELLNAVALANGETKVIDVNSYSATERSLYAKAGASNIDVTLIFDKVAW